MSAVISLRVEQDVLEALELIRAVGRQLDLMAEGGDDDIWEFSFENVSYRQAHAAVVGALRRTRPDWSSLVAVEYALVA